MSVHPKIHIFNAMRGSGPVVLNRGRRQQIYKFPGGREPLRALQHGKFY